MTTTAQPSLAPFAASPVMKRGRTFEEHEVGLTFDHPWGRTVLESDNALFTTATLGYEGRYLDAGYARALGLRREQVNPMLVFSIVFGLSVEDLSEIGGPFLGGQDLVFGAPVYPGDTLTARSTVIDARLSDSRPGVGIVTWETVGSTDTGVEVIRYRRTNLVRTGPLKNSIDPVEGHFEDFETGMRFWHSRSKTIGDVELSLLTPLVMNSAPGHFSDQAMAGTEFGRRINFGGQTLSLVVGLSFEDTAAQLVEEVGMTGIRFENPVMHGDTVSAHTEVIATAIGNTSVGEVTFRHTGINQRGETVCRVDRTIRVRRRSH